MASSKQVRDQTLSLHTAIDTIVSNPTHGATRAKAAAAGMLAAAGAAVGATDSFQDSRAVLDELARAKAQLDIAAWHTPDVTRVTAQLLSRAQAFVDEQTIPCTEWPTPAEVVSAVRAAADEQGAA